MDLAQLIDAFRALEEEADSVTVLGDDEAMRVLAAWRKTDQEWSRPRAKMPPATPGKHAALWRWVVSGWRYDVAAIALAAGVSSRVARDKMAMLVAARLIYPDGEVSRAARVALQLHVARKLGLKPTSKRDKGDRGKSTNESN